MPTFILNKLIRDKFRTIYDEQGQKIITRALNSVELKDEIRRKIIEEAHELVAEETRSEAVVSEIADIQQALDDLKAVYGIADEELRAVMAVKFEERGGFQEGLYVETIELMDSDEWVEYYRKEPGRFPEVGRDRLDATIVPSIVTGIYEHYKAKKYEVLGVALHSETLEPFVVYKPIYETKAKLWVRPYEMFIETVVIDGKEVPRFRKV